MSIYALGYPSNLVEGGGIHTVVDFGAVGDGVHNDTAAFLASVAATGGAVFPAGTFVLTGLAVAPAPLTVNVKPLTPFAMSAVPGTTPRIITAGIVVTSPAWPTSASSGTATFTGAGGRPVSVTGLTFDGSVPAAAGATPTGYLLTITGAKGTDAGGIADMGTVNGCTFAPGANTQATNPGGGLYLAFNPGLAGSCMDVTDCEFVTPPALGGGTVGLRADGGVNGTVTRCRVYGMEVGFWINGAGQNAEGWRVAHCLVFYCATGVLFDYAGTCVLDACIVDYTGLPLDVNSCTNMVVTSSWFGAQGTRFPPLTYVPASFVGGPPRLGFNPNGATGAWTLSAGTGSTTSVLTLVGTGSTNATNDPRLNRGFGLPMVITAASKAGYAGVYTIGAPAAPNQLNFSTGAVTVVATPVAGPIPTTLTTGDWISGYVCPTGTCAMVHNDSSIGKTPASIRFDTCSFYQYNAVNVPNVWIAGSTFVPASTSMQHAEIVGCTSYALSSTAVDFIHFMVAGQGGGSLYGSVRVHSNWCRGTVSNAGGGVAWVSGITLDTNSPGGAGATDGVYYFPTAGTTTVTGTANFVTPQ